MNKSLEVLRDLNIGLNTKINGNVSILGQEYLGGNLYANKGVTIGDTSNGTGIKLIVNGTGNVLKLGNFSTIDTSGNFSAERNINSNGTITTKSGFNIDISGNVTVSQNLIVNKSITNIGTLHTNSGINFDISGNIIGPGTLIVGNSISSTGTLSTNSGFLVDISGNNTVPGDSINMGDVTMNKSLEVLRDVSIGLNVKIDKNVSILGQEYLGGNLYANKGVTIGDTSNGAGIKLIVNGSGNILKIGNNCTIDTSGNFSASKSISTNGTIITNSGFSIDNSGNVSAPQKLMVSGQIHAGASISILGQEYLGGNVYANRGVTVGNSSNGVGVALQTVTNPTFNTLNMGYPSGNDIIDPSGNVIPDSSGSPIVLNVNGGVICDSITVNGITDASGYSFLNTNLDSSGVYFLDLETNNGSVVTNGLVLCTDSIKIMINGIPYNLMLSAV